MVTNIVPNVSTFCRVLCTALPNSLASSFLRREIMTVSQSETEQLHHQCLWQLSGIEVQVESAFFSLFSMQMCLLKRITPVILEWLCLFKLSYSTYFMKTLVILQNTVVFQLCAALKVTCLSLCLLPISYLNGKTQVQSLWESMPSAHWALGAGISRISEWVRPSFWVVKRLTTVWALFTCSLFYGKCLRGGIQHNFLLLF